MYLCRGCSEREGVTGNGNGDSKGEMEVIYLFMYLQSDNRIQKHIQ